MAIAVNKGDLGQGKGAIYEASVFDALNKAGKSVYCFAKESGLEIDFVISYNGYAALIEAKPKAVIQNPAKQSWLIRNTMAKQS